MSRGRHPHPICPRNVKRRQGRSGTRPSVTKEGSSKSEAPKDHESMAQLINYRRSGIGMRPGRGGSGGDGGAVEQGNE